MKHSSAHAAQGLGFPYLNPYLQAMGSNFTSGANFASAGASVLQPTTQVEVTKSLNFMLILLFLLKLESNPCI